MRYYPDVYADYTYTYIPSFFQFLLPLFALAVTIAGGLALYFLFARRENRFHGAAAKLHDLLTFRRFFTDRLLYALYCIAVTGIAVGSVVLLFSRFFLALAVFVLGNLIARLAFEGALLLFTLCRNVREINDKLPPREAELPPQPPEAPQPVPPQDTQPPQPPVPPQPTEAQPPAPPQDTLPPQG